MIIPTIDEGETVGAVVRGVLAAGADALVVDDASRDATTARAEAAGAHVLARGQRLGYGAAYRDGFAWGLERKYECIVQMDGDLSHDPAVLPELLACIARGNDVAIGSRYVTGGGVAAWSRRRRLLSRWANGFASFALRADVSDLTSGYRAYRAPVLIAALADPLHARGYSFQVELLRRILRTGGDVAEVPITFTDRQNGRSKMSLAIMVEALVRTTGWAISERIRRR